MTPRKHSGAVSELRVCSYLLEQGYEVFRNVSQHGPADIIAWHPETDEIRKIDVKTAAQVTLRDGSVVISPKRSGQENCDRLGVELVHVHPVTRETVEEV